MYSLSIFCSSKKVSLAIYKNLELKKFLKGQYHKNSNEILLLLTKRISKTSDFGQLSKIFFSTGPGSFTSIRAIKSLSQGISLSQGCRLEATDNFEIFLNLLKDRTGKYLIFFQISLYTYSFRLYKISRLGVKPLSKIRFGSIEKLKDYYFNVKTKEHFRIISDCKYNKKTFDFFEKEKLDIFEIDAKSLALACLNGKANEKLDILYHHTYYENS